MRRISVGYIGYIGTGQQQSQSLVDTGLVSGLSSLLFNALQTLHIPTDPVRNNDRHTTKLSLCNHLSRCGKTQRNPTKKSHQNPLICSTSQEESRGRKKITTHCRRRSPSRPHRRAGCGRRSTRGCTPCSVPPHGPAGPARCRRNRRNPTPSPPAAEHMKGRYANHSKIHLHTQRCRCAIKRWKLPANIHRHDSERQKMNQMMFANDLVYG